MSARGKTPDIAVIGAAGQTGRPLLRALAKRGAHVRAVVHSAARASEPLAAAEFAVADLADIGSLKNALQGVAVVHMIPPLFNPAEEQYAANAMQAAVDAGVSRFVYHSVLHADTPRMPHHVRKARVEIAIREAPLAWTIVQPAMYVSTPLRFFDEAEAVFKPPFNSGQFFNPIDSDDLADAVAAILCGSGHEFATYELAGPESLNFHEMATALSSALGRPVGVREVDPATSLRSRNFSAGMEAQARAMYAYYDAHGLPGNANVLRMLLGREPSTFAASVQRHFDSRAKT